MHRTKKIILQPLKLGDWFIPRYLLLDNCLSRMGKICD